MAKEITQTGYQNYKDLQKLNSYNFELSPEETSYFEKLHASHYTPDAYNPIANADRDVVSSVYGSKRGLGESKWDKNVMSADEFADINETRALAQTGLSKILSGLGKAAVLAGTTYADARLGTIVGIASGLEYLLTGNSFEDLEEQYKNGIEPQLGSKRTWKGFWNAFVNNPFSKVMQSVNKWSEEALPNYYTRDEIENPWKHFNANFWGDKLIKNLGFFVGAAFGGKANAKTLGELFKVDKIRDVYKGAVVAAGNAADKADDVYRALITGDKIADSFNVTDQLLRSAKQLRNAEKILQLAGGISAAMGEARIEAINNTQEWADLNYQRAEDDSNNKLKSYYNDLLADSDNVDFQTQEDGTILPVLNDLGQFILATKQKELEEELTNAKSKIRDQRTTMGNTIFALNTVLLSFGNVWQFGKFMAGGFRTGKIAANTGIKEGIKQVGKDAFELVKGRFTGSKLKALSNMLVEGNEEMAQSFISEIAGLSASSKLNSFYGYKIDPEASLEAISAFQAIPQGFKNTYGDKNTWQEGLIGAMTAALPFPTFTRVNTEVNGQTKSKLKFNGFTGMWGELKEVRENQKAAQELVDELNKRIKDPKFQNRWSSFIRHNSLQTVMDQYLAEGKEFNFKNSEHAQVLNDVLLFTKAGQTQYLMDMVEDAGNVSLEDVDQIRELAAKEDGSSIFEGKTDQEVVDHIKKQKEDYLDKIKTYREISESFKVLYSESMDDEALEEMTYMATQIKDWESRAKVLYDEVLSPLRERIEDIERVTGEKIDLNLNYIDLLDAFKSEDSAFVAAVDNINKIINNNNLSLEEQNAIIQKQVEVLNSKLNKARIATARAVREARKKGLSEEEIDKIRKRRKYYYGKRRQDLLFNIGLLNEYLNNNKESSISPIEGTELLNKLTDFVKIATSRNAFIKSMEILAKDPTAFNKEILQANREAEQKLISHFTDSVTAKAMAATSIEEFDSALAEAGEYEEAVLNNLESKSKDPKIKKFVQNHRELKKVSNVITNILSNKQHSPIVESAYNIINDAFTHSDDVDQAIGIIEETLVDQDVPQPVKDELTSILESFREQYKTESINDKDANQNSGKRNDAASSEPKSVFDNMSSNPNETYNPQDEEKGEQENPDEKKGNPPPPNPQSNPQETSSNPQEKQGETPETTENPVNETADIDENQRTFDADREAKDEAPVAAEDTDGKLSNAIQAKEDLPSVHTSSQEEVAEQPLERQEREENTKESNGYVQTLRSWIETLFDFTALKSKLRQAIRRINPITNAIDALGAYDYMDSGELADKLQKNPDLPIHFITTSEGVLQGKVLLAVKLEEGEDSKNAITAQDGKKYQVVGVLGYNKDAKSAPSEYRTIVDRVRNEAEDSQGYFVSSAYSKVQHIYSGRMVKSDGSNGVEQRSVTRAFLRGRPFHLGVLYNQGNFKTPTIDNSLNQVATPNTYNQNPNKGSVWLMVKEADGVYYPKAVTVRRFNPQEYSMDEFGNSPIVQEIKKNLRVLLDANASHYDRSLAKFALKDLLFFPEENDIVFKDKTSLVSLKGGYNNIGGGAVSLDEAVDNALKVLYEGGLNLRFNIATHRLGTDTSYSDMLLDSGVLSTDLLYPFNVNSSFDIAPIDDNGKPIVNTDYKTTGHTGHTGVNSTLTSNTFIFNGKPIRQVEGSDVLIDGYDVGVSRAITNAINDVLSGKIRAIEGDPNMFVINNPDGTFWVLVRDNGGGFRIPVNEEYFSRKERADKKLAKEQQQKSKDTLLDDMIEDGKENPTEDSQEAPKNGGSPIEESSKKTDESSPLDDLFGMEEIPLDTEEETQTPQEEEKSEKKSEKKEESNKEKNYKPNNVTEKKVESSNYKKVLNSEQNGERMEALGFDTILNLVEFCKNKKLIDPRTINTQEEADALFKMIEECR